jgi:hypothetical protein
LRAPLAARIAEWMRGWLDVVVSPQLATVATMLLVAVFVGTTTLSDDGSIGGMYRASLRYAAQTYERGANLPVRRAVMSGDLKQVRGSLGNLLGAPNEKRAQPDEIQPAASESNAQEKQVERQNR